MSFGWSLPYSYTYHACTSNSMLALHISSSLSTCIIHIIGVHYIARCRPLPLSVARCITHIFGYTLYNMGAIIIIIDPYHIACRNQASYHHLHRLHVHCIHVCITHIIIITINYKYIIWLIGHNIIIIVNYMYCTYRAYTSYNMLDHTWYHHHHHDWLHSLPISCLYII